MAADTFEDSWRRARLRMPGVPALLVRDWVQDAFTRAVEYRANGWSFQRSESSLDTLAARTVTITFTQGSTAITSAAAFVSTDAGRQIRTSANTYPYYTIASVTDPSNAILDRPFADTGGAISSTILTAYATLPADFKRFLVIIDREFQRIVPYWFSQDQLAISDPARRSSDSGARYVVAQGYSTATATLGQVRYEYWPQPTAAKHYPYLYYKKAARLADTDPFPGPFSNREDLFVLGAQLEAAEWPGTAEQKNPYFNLGLADRLEKKWADKLQELSLADDNIYPEDYIVVDFAKLYGVMTSTTSLLRQTDATTADYV